MIDFDALNQGFSGEARVYDNENEANPVIRWARSLVRAQVMRTIAPAGSILEINAGTGLDAAWLVEQGYRVHATDIADGMLAAIRSKVETSKTADLFTTQQLSFTELEKVTGAPYDAVFSNFGGLNCVPDLSLVTRGLKHALSPGGHLIWVVMPPLCPWEWLEVFRGRFRAATRRLHHGGVPANVSGTQVTTWYFTPQQVQNALGDDFQVISVQSFSLFCPPMYMQGFLRRFPGITRWLMRVDERVGRLPILNGWGDFFMLTARHLP